MSVSQNPDMELVGVLLAEILSQLTLNTKGAVAYHIDQASEMRDKIDVLIYAAAVQQIYLYKLLSLPDTLIRLTVLIPMQIFRDITQR